MHVIKNVKDGDFKFYEKIKTIPRYLIRPVTWGFK
jgi:hypothetical protein